MPSQYFQQIKGQSQVFHMECKFLFWSAFKGLKNHVGKVEIAGYLGFLVVVYSNSY